MKPRTCQPAWKGGHNYWQEPKLGRENASREEHSKTRGGIIGLLLRLVGNILTLMGFYLAGKKSRIGFFLSGLGNILWILTALLRYPWQGDLIAVNLIFLVLAYRNWYKWGNDGTSHSKSDGNPGVGNTDLPADTGW